MDTEGYVQSNSLLHTLDSRLKVAGFLGISLVITWASWQGMLVATVGMSILLGISKVTLNVFKTTLAMLLWVGVFYIVAGSWVITGGWRVWVGYFEPEGLLQASFLVWKIALIFFLTRLFSAVTSTLQQINGITYIFSPLARLTPKGADFLLLLSLTFRFIPLIVEEGKKVWIARLIKGDWPKSALQKIYELTRLIPPIVLLTLRRAEETGENLLLRGYASGAYRSLYYGNWGLRDTKATAMLLVWLTLIYLMEA